MAKKTIQEFTETGPDGIPVTMIRVVDAEPSPQPTAEELRAAIKCHELYLTQAIRDAHASWTEGRIVMLTQTLEILRKMEADL